MENFGNINNAFNELFINAILKKDNVGKRKFQQYLKMIKESDVLKTQYLVFKNIEDKFGLDNSDASEFVQENIKLLKSIDKSKLKAENNKLIKMLGEGAKYLKLEYPKKPLFENISNLISKPNPKNVDSIIVSKKAVIEYVVNNTEKDIITETSLPTKVLSKVMVKKFNEKYKGLDESSKNLLKLSINPDVEKQKEFYEENVKTCLSLINESLHNEKDVSIKERLLSVKERLLEMSYSVDAFSEDITKLINLKNDLIS